MLLMIALLEVDAPVANTEPRSSPPLIWSYDPKNHSAAHQMGLGCLPSGKFAMKDIAIPDETKLRSLMRAGASAEVLMMKASLCSAYMGVGPGPSSRINLNIQWHMDGEKCGRPISTTVKMKNIDLRFNPQVFTEALQLSYLQVSEDGCSSD